MIKEVVGKDVTYTVVGSPAQVGQAKDLIRMNSAIVCILFILFILYPFYISLSSILFYLFILFIIYVSFNNLNASAALSQSSTKYFQRTTNW